MMHVAQVIGAGTALLGLFLLFGRLWGVPVPDYVFAAKLFIPVWLLVALVNLWVGVTRAGYSLSQELPILVLVFAIPAAIAVLAMWHFGKG